MEQLLNPALCPTGLEMSCWGPAAHPGLNWEKISLLKEQECPNSPHAATSFDAMCVQLYPDTKILNEPNFNLIKL